MSGWSTNFDDSMFLFFKSFEPAGPYSFSKLVLRLKCSLEGSILRFISVHGRSAYTSLHRTFSVCYHSSGGREWHSLRNQWYSSTEKAEGWTDLDWLIITIYIPIDSDLGLTCSYYRLWTSSIDRFTCRQGCECSWVMESCFREPKNLRTSNPDQSCLGTHPTQLCLATHEKTSRNWKHEEKKQITQKNREKEKRW